MSKGESIADILDSYGMLVVPQMNGRNRNHMTVLEILARQSFEDQIEDDLALPAEV